MFSTGVLLNVTHTLTTTIVTILYGYVYMAEHHVLIVITSWGKPIDVTELSETKQLLLHNAESLIKVLS